MQNMECPKNSMIIARQWTLCKMRKGKVFKSIFRRIFLKKQDSYANRGDKLGQLALEDKSYTAIRRERTRYENNWRSSVRADSTRAVRRTCYSRVATM